MSTSVKARAARQRCALLREYHKGRARLVCRTHGWSTRWGTNEDVLFLLLAHEQDVAGGKERR